MRTNNQVGGPGLDCETWVFRSNNRRLKNRFLDPAINRRVEYANVYRTRRNPALW
jgi:hypothetical protein